MNIIDDLLNVAHSTSSDFPVQDILIGLHWIGVHSRYLGLAATLHDKSCCFSDDIRGSGHLHEKSAFELSEFLRSSHSPETSVGMAALNSILPVDDLNFLELNARDLLVRKSYGRRVAMVGHFHFTEEIRRFAANLWILELDPAHGDLPSSEAPNYLPQADVIGITATTLINGTFENLAPLFPTNALVIMLGPSTPLCTVLFDYGIDVLAGSMVSEPGGILRCIGQGSALHKSKGLKRLTMVRDQSLVF